MSETTTLVLDILFGSLYALATGYYIVKRIKWMRRWDGGKSKVLQ